MIYRVDVILNDGKRRRAIYDSDRQKVVEMSKCKFGADDVMLEGAVLITGNAEARELLEQNGFTVQKPDKGNNFCIRITDELAQQIFALSKETGCNEASLIRTALVYWLDNGHPMPD